MTISIWRYSHLVLAVSCCLFLAIAAGTGIILSANSVKQQATARRVAATDTISIAQTIEHLEGQYMQLSELSVDKYKQVSLTALDDDGKELSVLIDPSNGKVLGKKEKKNAFIQSVTSLHRSLFLHDLGRVFIGITAFLLFLIALTGIVLILQRQQGLRRFFGKIVKEYFAQYFHIIFGRLLLIPIVIIAFTGTLMTMKRFHLLPEKNTTVQLSKATTDEEATAKDAKDISLFQKTKLKDIKMLSFPFSEDIGDNYKLKLADREMVIDQFSGNIVSEVRYPFSEILRQWSLILHTGRSSMLWSVVLGLAALGILFFIYSGFVITFRRTAKRGGKWQNKYTADNADIVILVGSETGNTLRFAHAIAQQLLAGGQHPFVTELNKYSLFPQAKQIIIMTATFGMGDAPTNAEKFESLLPTIPQKQKIKMSVVAFGSQAYPDFCGYGKKLDAILQQTDWAEMLLPVHTVNDQSAEDFSIWVRAWSDAAGIPLVASAALYTDKPKPKQRFIVVEKKGSAENSDIFTLKLRLDAKNNFTSGDLLCIYPADDLRERFYSIGKLDKDIHLAIRKIDGGLGSEYLHALQPGKIIEARIVENKNFHFPAQAPEVLLIANGTGIAPFLGMIAQNNGKIPIHLYAGFRTKQIFQSIAGDLPEKALENGHLSSVQLAFSRENDSKQYVTHLLEKDLDTIFHRLQNGAVCMLCGSLSMGNDVLRLLEKNCKDKTGMEWDIFKDNGQVKMDCY